MFKEISDWHVRNKISESEASVRRVLVEVNNVMNKLKQMKRNEENRINQMKSELNQIVVNS